MGGSVAKRLEDLAIFGGPPAFAEPLHVGRPNLPDRAGFLQLVEEIFDGGWLTNEGPLVERFERRIAELADVEHCVATANGTLGLQLAARALGFSGEVIVPSFTFVATAHALTWLGLTPVFCDIRRETHTIDPEALERLVTPRTGGIVAVHLWGRPCEIEPLAQFARERGLPLLFDAAQAVGCSHAGRAIGGFGDAEVFSFHATKVVSAAEGGAVTTDDGELAERLRSMRNFGFSGYDTVIELGINAKMSELSAAMGLASIEDLDRIVALNRRIYLRYWRELGGVPGIRLLSYDESERHNYQYVVLQVGAEGESELRRDDLLAVLHAENVLARRYFYPGCHRLDAYAADAAGALPDLPATDEVAAHVLTLPTGTQIDEVDVETVCSIVRVAAEHPDELRQRLNAAAVA